MWVFDGEEWTEEGNGNASAKPEERRPRWEELMPELQVVEIVPVTVPLPSRNVPHAIP
ncbi:MAG TPA: hypothetical protein VGR02_08395 [Thermoanaerobaculia bacterium]|jgi:hypothetical protein|nr:hypothetical protein [Thermoanaerobaculia bacterium]